jgi:hypothetical protein
MTSSMQYGRILEYLLKNKAIPSASLEALEERLVIACEVRIHNTPRLKGHPLPRKQVRSRSVRKKAQWVYLKVLKEAPHTFLPFILASSPNACQGFAIDDFCQEHVSDKRLELNAENKELFEDIAMRRGIRNSHYSEVVQLLFSNTSLPADQPEKSFLPFRFTELLEFLSGRQDGQAELQMVCPFQGAPLPYIELDLGSAPGVKSKFLFSYEESAAFVNFISLRRQ